MHVYRVHSQVMALEMTFARVIYNIFKTLMMLEITKYLYVPIMEPKVACFHSAQFLTFEGIVQNSDHGGVINVDGHERLRMAKILEDKLHGFSFFCIDECGTQFHFSC